MKALSGGCHMYMKPNIMPVTICVHVPSQADVGRTPSSGPKVIAIMALQMSLAMAGPCPVSQAIWQWFAAT